jgi:hypothetical protein
LKEISQNGKTFSWNNYKRVNIHINKIRTEIIMDVSFKNYYMGLF